MDPKIEAALLRAVCTLIDRGRFELGVVEAETPEEYAVLRFMIGLRIGSRVRRTGDNVWELELPTDPDPE